MTLKGDRGATGEKGKKGEKGDVGDPGLSGEPVSDFFSHICFLKLLNTKVGVCFSCYLTTHNLKCLRN